MNNYNSQWVSFHIRGHLDKGDVLIQNTVIEGGEFYDVYDRRKSLTEEEIDEIVIASDGVGEIGAQSRRGSEGRLDLFHDNDKICELHWENRGGKHVNVVEILDQSAKYNIEHRGWSSEEGPLGHVYMDIFAKK